MQNQINFSLPVQDLFLNPAVDGGISLPYPAEFFWRPATPALIQGFATSAFEEVNYKINAYLNVTKRHKIFSQAIEFNTVPVLLEQACFSESFALAQGKVLLPGARLLKRYCWENQEDDLDPEEQLVSYFQDCQRQNIDASIPLYTQALPENLAVAIACRSITNPYAFIAEALPQLAQIAGSGFRGDVFFHFSNRVKSPHPAVQEIVADLFPEFVGRIFFEPAPKHYDHVLTVLDLLHVYFQFPTEVVGSVAHLAPSDAMFRGHDGYVESRTILSMNAFSSSLSALRRRGLRAIEGKDFSYLPKRFFVGLPDDAPSIVGAEQLLEMLRLFGFQRVDFDKLSPLEQIAIMANAEMAITPHSANLTHMMFASPQTFVLVLGTLQTAVHRWDEYWGHAHVSGCHYISFFADFDAPDPKVSPSIDLDGMVPVALSDQTVAEVLAFIVCILGYFPGLPTARSLLTLAERLICVGEHDHALQLLENHSDLVKTHAGLCVAKADCHKARAEPYQEIAALYLAYDLDKSDVKILLRIFWGAKRADRSDIMSWARSRCAEISRTVTALSSSPILGWHCCPEVSLNGLCRMGCLFKSV
ncbi:glycosyltransferase 61 family protein [Pseudorhodobacter aquimaris]|uniref:glycosyltransferase 61 family protein n=1 Tax=Pseudorhodobacter aquimaris TaxID=687412 RepID=UPI00067BA680|nr:glycosyltransferase family 61 protein [Pseudorhodobacter aquimaris]